MSRLELVVAALGALVFGALVLAEPDILEAPFENGRTLGLTFGGALVASVAFVAMLGLRVPPLARVAVVGAPVAVVSWWLLSPFFVDDVVHDRFATSIAASLDAPPDTGTATTTGSPATDGPTTDGPETDGPETDGPATDGPATDGPATDDGAPGAPAAPDGPVPTGPAPPVPAAGDPPAGSPSSPASVPTPSGPVLLGAGAIRGLAGHDGTGDAGFFRLDDGSLVLRLERLDIDNGPDLELYVVPGADRTSPADGAVHLGALRGNVGEQTYPLPPDVPLAPGAWTVLVWCEAFDVEFVGATVVVV